MALSTKQQLAQSLKELMAEKPLDKITVKEIVARCGVNRQTFYYHFRDIYNLLDWFFEEEGKVFMRRYPDATFVGNGSQAIRLICEYLIENRDMAINIYNSLGRDRFGDYLNGEFLKLLSTVLTPHVENKNLSHGAADVMISFYTHAVVGSLLDWVSGGLIGKVENIVALYTPLLRDGIECALQRLIVE
ncbi:MAG TPA: TetR/AcrR family transcriptional regulator C-terminal domain-containing protein [Sphaerochaeta sp.]|nr:TetR/AcrR family transcriptional regulator C-terminal domain-containing protein [Sphaerochaeta sp.]